MSGGDRRLGLVYWRIDVTKSSKSYRARLCDRSLVIGCVAFALMAVYSAFSQVPIADSTGPASTTFPEQQPLPKDDHKHLPVTNEDVGFYATSPSGCTRPPPPFDARAER